MSKRKEPTRTITCCDCGVVFEHKGRGRCLRCASCRKANANKRSREHAIKRGKIKNPGVGSGGAQKGAANHQWKGGIAAYRRYGKEDKELVCETCGKELNKHNWCVHHIDEDPSNNERENLKLVCRACHQNVEHTPNRGSDGRYQPK